MIEKNSILKKGNRDRKWKNDEIKKVWKQVREWKQVKDGAQGLLRISRTKFLGICYPYSDCIWFMIVD